jgi:hypothetical protein
MLCFKGNTNVLWLSCAAAPTIIIPDIFGVAALALITNFRRCEAAEWRQQ